MKKLLLIILISQISISLFSQQNSIEQEHSVIEVNGFAIKEIIPNEIYITLTIHEYYQGRKLISISQQEKQLLDSLQKYSIPKSSIKTYNADAKYTKVKLLKKGTVSTAKYSILGKNAKDVQNIFSIFKSMKIKTAFIEKVDHSELESFKKDVRIKAIKDAKEKAQYLLEAIDQKIDAPLLIKETYIGNNHVTMRGSRADATDYYLDGIRVSQYVVPNLDDQEIEFKKIEVQSNIFIKFKIK